MTKLSDLVSRASLKAVLHRARKAAFAVWSVLSPVAWAEGVRRMPRSGGGTRPFSFRYAPYQREMFLSLFDPRAQEVVFQVFSRGGKSEVVLNALGYWIDEVPSSIFVMWPTLGQAKKWSKDNLQRELIDPTPALSARIGDGAGRRKSDNTLLHKLFDGGLIDMVGANSPGDIRRAKGNRLYADEIDAILEIQSDEGDQLAQFKGRGDEFPDTREVYCSYPSLKGRSRIEAKYLESDRRQWVVKCLVCGGEVIMHRTGVDTFSDGIARTRLTWPPGKPEEAYLECPHNGCRIDDKMRHRMMCGGDPANPRFDLWRPTNPFAGRIGFQGNAMLWPHPVDREKFPGGYLHKLAQDMINVEKSDNPERSLRVLVNRVDAETFQSAADAKPEHSALYRRREQYDPAQMLPAGVLVIVFFVDVQLDRIELFIQGFGENHQVWDLDYIVIPGGKGAPMVRPTEGVWAELDRILLTTSYPHPSGKVMRISGGLVDAGNWRDHVFEYTRTRIRRRIYASRGDTELSRPIVGSKPQREGKHKTPVFVLGTHAAKEIIYQRLAQDNKASTGYRHYPELGQFSEHYFKMLLSEDSEDRQGRDGDWHKWFGFLDGIKKRNEPLDGAVGCMAMERILRPNYEKLAVEFAVSEQGASPAKPTPPAQSAPGGIKSFMPQKKLGGFVGRWKR